MDLEKEIFTDKFENSYHKAAVNIIYTYGWLTDQLKKRLKSQDLTLQQFNILRILRGQYPNPATVNLLKERMLDKMCDASRIVDRLIQKEFVTRCINKTDRRAVDIKINPKGLEMLKGLDHQMSGTDFLKDNLTEKEAEILSKLLDKFRGY
ncbi:MAG TPA: MarR family transcriptional regulator [Sphingobacteriaceae bacterium]|nr:MarR family transcriptional regulator [Sphingobacteriaceae bacterium]